MDDHELGLKTRAILLRYEGYSVLTATTAAEGWQMFANADIDLVITDYYLPDQLGTELASRMKALRPNVPILLLSGSIETPEHLGGADVFLSKAADLSVFLSCVRDLSGKAAREYSLTK